MLGIGDHHWSSFWFSNKQHYLSLLGSTDSVAGVYEHRRTTILIKFRHRSCRRRADTVGHYLKKKMSPKGGNKHPASILPGSWEQESLSLGTRFADKELEDGKILDAQRTPVRRHQIGDQLRRFIERRQFLDSGMHLFKLSGSCAVWNQTDCVRL